MSKFRKKPVVIEAIQFLGDENLQECLDFLQGQKCGGDDLTIVTLEGDMRVSENDFIIKGVQGEFYPCKPDIFKATYDIVEDVAVDSEPTFGELAVGLSFNPSNFSDVDKVKRSFAELIDTCYNLSTFTYLGNTLKGMAIRACIEAQMAVVKLITFKEK